MPKPKLPGRFGVGVRVIEKKRSARARLTARTGTIRKAAGRQKWEVEFDGENGTEERTTASLQYSKESYGAPLNTPDRPANSTVRKSVPSTGVRRYPRRQNAENRSSNIAEQESSSNGEDSNQSFNSEGEEESFETQTPRTKPRRKRKTVVTAILSAAARAFSPLSNASKSTDHPESRSSASIGRQLFPEQSEPFPVLDDVHIPEEEEEEFDDMAEKHEDDDCRGDTFFATDDEGGRQVEYIDEPQKAEKYRLAKQKMMEEKKALIAEEHTFEVTVKTKQAYTFGGRVQGRDKSEFEGCAGTIVGVLSPTLYKIEWDDGETCEARKTQLKLVQTTSKVYSWKVVEDHVADNQPTAYNDIGVVGFKSSSFNNLNRKSPTYDHPYAKLLLALWPGDWRAQLKKLNDAIDKFNREHRPARTQKHCSEDEWWKFWGIIIFAAKAGVGGVTHLYDRDKKVIEQLQGIDLFAIMKKYRLEQLIRLMPESFYGDNVDDPWNAVAALVDGFNANRAELVAASHIKVHDETMSSWHPTTTPWGGLPFLSFILRKPKPLGTEFKSTACAITGESFLSFAYTTIFIVKCPSL